MLLFLVLSLALFPDSSVASPHGGFSPITDKCLVCHDLHRPGGAPVIRAATPKALCYTCHDGTGASSDIRSEFGETSQGPSPASRHPVPEGIIGCASCHTPHEGPEDGNPSSLSVGEDRAKTGTAVCGGCHGPGSELPGGDVVSGIGGTPHAGMTPADSPATIACRGCHEPHGSSKSALIAPEVRSASGETVTVESAATLCYQCHDVGVGTYPGAELALQTKHSTVTTSSRALTQYPGTSEKTACNGCHDLHDGSDAPAYVREAGDATCRTCHDDASASYPSGYSYRGASAMGASGHGTLAGGYQTVMLGSGSEGFAAWESTTQPTPSSPGAPMGSDKKSALSSTDGSKAVTSLQTVTGGYDYQMYRFVLPSPAGDVVSVRLGWAGFGEETPGYPVTVSCWDFTANGGTGGWSVLRTGMAADLLTIDLNLDLARFRDAEGRVYVMASARYVHDTEITSAPTFTAINSASARIDWETAGLTDTKLDYGATSGYGSTLGSSTRTRSHSVTVAGLTQGSWHFNMSSTAGDGESYSSGDVVRGMPSAVTTPLADIWVEEPALGNALFQWTPPAGSTAPVEYRLRVWSTAPVYTSPWMTGTSHSLSLTGGTYYWTVEARDATGLVYVPSVTDSFVVYQYSSSCPFLFTWDGQQFAFEADLFGAGKLGTKTKTGYLKPDPVDYYFLQNEPDVRNGAYEFRLVEERYEVDYLDRLSLLEAIVPENRDVFAEKPQADGPAFDGLTNSLHTVSTQLGDPVSAVHVNASADVSAKIAENDEEYLVLNEDRNVGFEYQTIELDLGDVANAPQVKIVMDAMSLFPDSPEGVQRASTFGARTKLEVQDETGAWKVVPAASGSLPKPPEFSRPYVFDISDVWQGPSRKVRFTFLFKTYVDWIKVDTTADVPVQLRELTNLGTELRARGVDEKSGPEEIFEYVYGQPTGELLYFNGFFTKFGDVRSLLDKVDDKFVIFGGGDELAMRFKPAGQVEPGMRRKLLVYTHGYYKDAKVALGTEVEPLPFNSMSNFPYAEDEHYPDDPEHDAYRAEWNTRFEGVPKVTEPVEASIISQAVSWIGQLFSAVADAVVDLLSTDSAQAAGEPIMRSLNVDYVGLTVTVTGASGGGSCGACHAVHGATDKGAMSAGQVAGSQGRVCTGGGSGGCHASATNSASGVDIGQRVTASSDARAHHDVMPEVQLATNGKTDCSACHNPHRDNAESPYSDPDARDLPGPSDLRTMVSESGYLYMLVGADHDGVAPVLSGQTISLPGDGTSAQITWNTNEPSTSWVDWGLTTDYELGNETSGTPFGSDTLSSTHSVMMSALSTDTAYHYRVRSRDALGNVRLGPDTVYDWRIAPPTTPTPTKAVDSNGLAPHYKTLTWPAVTSSDGHPVEYYAELVGSPANNSGWISSTSWSTAFTASGTYAWRLKARDAAHQFAVSPWSTESTFTVTIDEPTSSCPFLFTWNGDEYAFEADLYGAGKLATKTKTGYLRPQPSDCYVLGETPVARAGAFEMRIVEERFEVDYLDAVKLYSVDVPPDRTVYAEKPEAGKGYNAVDGVLHTVSLEPAKPLSARHVQSGADVLDLIGERDGERLMLNEDRNVDFDYQTIELDLGAVASAPQIKLIMDAQSVFPDSPEGTTRSASFGARTKLEVQDAAGNWVLVPSSAGSLPKAPEFSRPYAFDISNIWQGPSRKVRLTFLFKTYVDWIAVDTTLDVDVRPTEVPLLEAQLSKHGIDQMLPEGDLYTYRYGSDTHSGQLFPGAYTRYGEVSPLLQSVDDMFVVYGTGDELALRFRNTGQAPAGAVRKYVMFTEGYYKDAKVDVPRAVEPLPFKAMSNFPYAEDEHYPDDAEHQAYLAEWNTRTVGGEEVGWWETVVRFFARLFDGAPGNHRDKGAEVAKATRRPGTAIAKREPVVAPGPFSVDTDLAVLRLTETDGSIATVMPDAAWETEGSATPPTPSAPGSAVSGARLGAVNADDSTYLRTELTTEDRRWNWQVIRFDLSAYSAAEIKNIIASWNGHGEPTAGYKTRIAVWDPSSDAWTTIRNADTATDASARKQVETVPSALCMRCHDGTPPAGVVFPSNVAAIGTLWSDAANGDFHGAKAGAGFGSSGLSGEFTRGYPAISCSVCHDTHGNGNLYHVATTVNGQSGVSVTTGAELRNLCRTCHLGGVSEWHAPCVDCHDEPDHYGDITYLLPNDGTDCLRCHGHGRGFTHQQSVCGHCHVYLDYPRGL